MPVELTMVAAAAILLVTLLLLAAGPRTMTYGLDWASGPRDTVPGSVSARGQRLERAYRNMLETYPVFASLAVAVVAAGASEAVTALGSQIYVAARLVYVPAYVFHVPFLRSTIWLVSMIGVAMVGWPLVRGIVA